MTTNAIDFHKKTLSSDSRWSITLNGKLYFVDDTGFDKIADRHVGAIICAGDGELIEQWRNWFTAPVLNMANKPPYDRRDHHGQDFAIVISLAYKTDGYPVLSQGWYLLHGTDAKFCGSGAEHAYACYSQNKCGRTSIGSAAMIDAMTGGETKYVELETSKNNLSTAPSSLAQALDSLNKRGNVMDLSTGNVTPIVPQASDELAAALSAGLVTLSAPTGQRVRLWTDAEKQNMDQALQRLADLEQAVNDR